jgi:large subunit ribosomal protein L10
MPILRAQKEDLVAKLTEELHSSRVALVFAYTALNMKANDILRTRAFEGGAKVKMISNNLLRLILKNISRELEIPERTLALAYGFQDEVIAAKTLVEFAKETETLEVLGGWIDGNFFDTSQIKTLATLPTKVALQAQLVGRLNGMIG